MTKEQALLTQYFLIGEPPKVRSIKTGEYIELAKYSFSYDMLTDTEGKGYYIDDIQLELYSLDTIIKNVKDADWFKMTGAEYGLKKQLELPYGKRSYFVNNELISYNVWIGGESKQVKIVPRPKTKISDFNPRTVTPEEIEKNRLPYDIKL